MVERIDKSSCPIIYLTGYGFEERTTAVINYLKENFDEEKHYFKYAFSFGDPSSELGKSKKWQQNKYIIDEFLTTHSEIYIRVPTSIRDPLGIRLLFKKILQQNKINLSEHHILVDITSFPKITFLSVFTELLNRKSKGTLLYVEPEDYELPLSLGAKYFGFLPQFGNFYNPMRKRTLIAILGFEGERAYAVWNNCEPDETIALIGEPFYSNEIWEEISERENKLILACPRVEKDFISFTDPIKALEKLEEKYEKYKEENIIVAPLGTKFSTIPVVYFIRNKPNVFVVFSAAERESEHQSIGCKTLITCEFNHLRVGNTERISL